MVLVVITSVLMVHYLVIKFGEDGSDVCDVLSGAETDPDSRASETSVPPRVAPPMTADTDTASVAADSPPHQRGRKR